MGAAPEVSGVDLAARHSSLPGLLAAREAAKARKTETRQKPKRRTTVVARRLGLPIEDGPASAPVQPSTVPGPHTGRRPRHQRRLGPGFQGIR
ncbi:hypothetical protein [Streptomyces sp. NPDC004266]|uniref:hypothetical protein n=1 Tax=Streptomyces sp. NPDC004266 TaxID=3364693 RepID=UPI0036C65098